MAIIELYINKQLCETENAENFSVYLKRQFINPVELSTKDAQRSYDITLPATAANNEIFGYINTEEVKGKFSQLYDAQLYVDGVKIFDGKFRLSEITKDSYKGNLGIPAAKTVKDIFGDRMMNETGKWLVDFRDARDMTKYNTGKHDKSKYGEISPCLFPYVLYKIPPKKPVNGAYTPKNVLDKTTAFKHTDFPPSINCVQALQEIFKGKGFKLSGTATEDPKLKNLYMSYKNPDSYNVAWTQEMASLNLRVDWDNMTKSQSFNSPLSAEGEYSRTGNVLYAVDLLNCDNAAVEQHSDSGKMFGEVDGKRVIVVPESGLYKIRMHASIVIDQSVSNEIYNESGPAILSAKSDWPVDFKGNFDYMEETFRSGRYEVKLQRYKADEEIDTEKTKCDNVFYKDNQDQEKSDIPSESKLKIFPRPGMVNFVDLKQNENLLCGLAFGEIEDKSYNPAEKNERYCNPIAIKNGKSWDWEMDNNEVISATYSPGYMEAYMDSGVEKYRNSEIKNRVDITDMGSYAIIDKDYFGGSGLVYQVVWLDAGEKLTVITNSDEITQKYPHFIYSKKGVSIEVRERYGWVRHRVTVDLDISAFRKDKGWVKIDEKNQTIGNEKMDWNDPADFEAGQIDLIRFLPSNVKTDEWITGFCKTFNLDMVQTGKETFELNTKSKRQIDVSSVIDLDQKTDVNLWRKNNSLNLPSVYEFGFKLDEKEQGYVKDGDNGGGNYETGSDEYGKPSNHVSTFSYNWYETITDTASKEQKVPVIMEAETWQKADRNYAEMMDKKFMDKTQRFWYWRKNKSFVVEVNNDNPVDIALVSDTFRSDSDSMRLDYRQKRKGTDAADSIFDNYFTILADAGNSYTVIECFLTASEYDSLTDNLVRYNNTLYYVADIDGYDPMCRKKTVLKLIRYSQL
ncbi:hypothetical protein [Dysgonomonas sp. BGC7]|uniref:hypothetical protein n=1 Tax=Dysgonomonas sp. BGC7 TaxID=1658008 RepID=UPI000682482E|nr:hypothetical protein [Dysgonomonas sp. BGC7]MBD8389009.1 hypothetical protein [Dysgonomonas sp. BGC7]